MERSLHDCKLKDEKPAHTIGDKVTAKFKTFFNEQTDDLHRVWIPMIEVDGQMMGIADETTFSGQKEAPSRYYALKVARHIRDEVKVRVGLLYSETIQLSDLHPGDLVNLDGEVITKEEAQQRIAAGERPTLYTVSDAFIAGALRATYEECKAGGGVGADHYTAPDPDAKRILY